MADLLKSADICRWYHGYSTAWIGRGLVELS